MRIRESFFGQTVIPCLFLVFIKTPQMTPLDVVCFKVNIKRHLMFSSFTQKHEMIRESSKENKSTSCKFVKIEFFTAFFASLLQ